MTINDKISEIKKITQEIKNITKKIDNDNVLECKIEEMKQEISRLKKGIGESIDELDEIFGE